MVAINGRTLEDILLIEKLVVSKSEIRRLVEAGAITDENQNLLTMEMVKIGAPINGTYKIGKNRFIKLV
jgi:hypothetical protein